MVTTRLSSKGQLILPKTVRAQHGWKSGTEFIVEEAAEGILLRPLKRFKRTRLTEVLGCAGYSGPAKTIAEMEQAIALGARGKK